MATHIGLALACSLLLAAPAAAQSGQLDETWTVTLNGQTTQANPDGSFRITNVPAVDEFPADFVGDETVRVVAYSSQGGVVTYAASDPFQLTQGQTFSLDNITILGPPPVTSSALDVELPTKLLEVGETAQLDAIAQRSDGSRLNVTALDETTYRVSSLGVVTVSGDGLVTGIGAGDASITVTHEGATSVVAVRVVDDLVPTTVVGFVVLPDGTRVSGAEVRTTFGGLAVTGSDGLFMISVAVPDGANVAALAEAVVGGQSFVGASEPAPPVLGGFTDTGFTVLQPGFFGALYGNPAYEVGDNPRSVGLGDVDGDGDTDLAAANLTAGSVSVLVNDGYGGLRLADTVGAGVNPAAVLVVDLNGDGFGDLAAANQTSADVSVSLSNGDGTFAAASFFPVGFAPIGLAAGDVDGDGIPDLAVANSAGASVSVLPGLGGGAFGPQATYPIAGNPAAVQLADLDGDLDLDLAVAQSSVVNSALNVLLNDGTGAFAPAVPRGAGTGANDLVVADLDGDSDLDVAGSGNGTVSGPAVHVFLNVGGGAFGAPASYPAGANPDGIDAADLDGDGDLDLSVANSTSQSLSTLLNDGAGGFGPPAASPLAGTANDALRLGDLDGDGVAEAVVPSADSDVVNALMGRGDGGFATPTALSVAGPDTAAVADLDGDGDLDLAVTGTAGVSVFLGNGDGTYGAPLVYPAGATPTDMVAGDLDMDGDFDLVVMNFGSGNVSVLLNDGAGAFAAPADYSTAGAPVAVAIDDFDLDLDLDLAVLDLLGTVSVRFNDGAGAFGPETVLTTSGFFTSALAAGDLTGDGAGDLVSVTPGSLGPALLSILISNGDGTFAPEALVLAGNSPDSVVLDDFDLDGDLDLAVSNSGGAGDVSIFPNQGTGTFGPDTRFDAGATPRELASADLDGDGTPDLVAVTTLAGPFSDSLITVLRNLGGGSFAEDQPYGTDSGPSTVSIADLDLDGDADLVVVNASASTVWIYLGLRIP